MDVVDFAIDEIRLDYLHGHDLDAEWKFVLSVMRLNYERVYHSMMGCIDSGLA